MRCDDEGKQKISKKKQENYLLYSTLVFTSTKFPFVHFVLLVSLFTFTFTTNNFHIINFRLKSDFPIIFTKITNFLNTTRLIGKTIVNFPNWNNTSKYIIIIKFTLCWKNHTFIGMNDVVNNIR